MACDKKTNNIVLEGMNIFFGKKNTTCVTPNLGSPAAGYFTISNTVGKFYVWMDTTGSDTDPAPAGYTAIPVDISAATTEAEIVALMKTAVEVEAFWATISSDTLSLKIESKVVGVVVEASADVDSTYTIETDIVGVGGFLGKTEAVELSMEVTTFDITANQTGETVLDKFITGMSASASTTLLEMTKENWALLVGEGVGGNYLPAAGTVVTGYGSASINKSFFDIAGELVMHPVRLPIADMSRDVTIFKCVVQPESINFDSLEKQGMAISFTALLDESKEENINLFGFGDSSQDLRA